MDHHDRAQTPHSFMSVSTFVSFASNSPAPEPPSATPRMASAGGLPFDEHISPNGGGFLGARKADTLRSQMRARTLSNVSCISNSTWWSAVASVSSEPEQQHQQQQQQQQEEKEIKLGTPAPAVVRKIDSAVALEGVQERRESIASSSRGSTSQRRSPKQKKENERPNSSSSKPKLLSRQSSTSASTVTMVNTTRSFRRRSTSVGTETPSTFTVTPSDSSQRKLRPSTAAAPPDWASAEAIIELRRQKRREIEQSLEQKYPNDRCHGEFLPFNTDFSHSADSLSPVRFLSPSSLRQVSSSGTMVATASTPVTPLDPTITTWKNLDSLRAEYAAADRRKSSAWGWIRRRVLCGAGILGCGGKKEFWEDGDEDKGSVRRYRLELPDRDEGAVKALPVRVRSVDTNIKPSTTAAAAGTHLCVEADEDGPEKWSVVGVLEGKRVQDDVGLPPGFREEEAASPFLASTVRGVV
ncbi:hypothetical protein BDD12DRAFT_883680 [Trichophaea hybrida]|nr:hypothetical protein BDD12DRAFT_883680 [Trichophaea hybrida]